MPTSSLASPAAPPAREGRHVALVLGAWGLVALAVALSGVLGRLMPRAPFVVPGTILATTAAGLWLHARWPALRRQLASVDLRLLVLFHLVRVPFGVAFLVLESRGQLAPLFAQTAGWGDILAGALALPAALAAGRLSPGRARGVWGWNLLGLLDMVLVLASAQRVLFSPAREQLLSLTHFPFSTLPVLVVPLILLSHALVFARLRAARA